MTSDRSNPSELERRVDRALKRLPTPPAPATLLARVMAGVREPSPGAAPALVPASEWPLALRIALVAVSVAMVAGALLLWPLALDWARTTWQSPAIVLVRVAAGAARPMLPIVLMYLAAMCAACAAAASVLKHVALGGASQS